MALGRGVYSKALPGYFGGALMNQANPPAPHQSSDFPLPEFLGTPPNEGPERLPEKPWDFILCVIGMISDRYPGQEPTPTDAQLRRLIQLWEIVPIDEWGKTTGRFLRTPEYWGTSPDIAWQGAIFSLTPETHASTDRPKPAVIKKEKKHAPPSREFLLLLSKFKSAPNPQLYERVFLTIHAHCFNKLSKTGRKVHPYGQLHACKAAGLPLRKLKDGSFRPGRTFQRIWAWLVNRGIINKAWNENRETGKCAGWYVCTSLPQRDHFRIPRDHPKKIRP